MPKENIVLNHHVAVYGRLENGDWAMASDEQGRFTFRPCTDFPTDKILNQAVGYVADHAKWDERAECKSIQRADLGFFWRDENWKYRRIQ